MTITYGALTNGTVALMKLEKNSLSLAPTYKVTISSENSANTKQPYFKLLA